MMTGCGCGVWSEVVILTFGSARKDEVRDGARLTNHKYEAVAMKGVRAGVRLATPPSFYYLPEFLPFSSNFGEHQFSRKFRKVPIFGIDIFANADYNAWVLNQLW
jgi:hypothetical protein